MKVQDLPPSAVKERFQKELDDIQVEIEDRNVLAWGIVYLTPDGPYTVRDWENPLHQMALIGALESLKGESMPDLGDPEEVEDD